MRLPDDSRISSTLTNEEACLFAKPDCGHCHGQGWLHYIAPEDKIVICVCAKKQIAKYAAKD